MLDEWERTVGADDLMLCLGDVAHPYGLVGPKLAARLRAAPGRRRLVLGNHDVEPVNQVRPVAVGRSAATLFAPGDPPLLLLTHVPLLQVTVRLGKRARTRAPEGVADQEPAHQRERRAIELPAREAERHPAAGPPTAERKDRPRAQHSGAAERRGTRHAVTANSVNEIKRVQRHEKLKRAQLAEAMENARRGRSRTWRRAQGTTHVRGLCRGFTAFDNSRVNVAEPKKKGRPRERRARKRTKHWRDDEDRGTTGQGRTARLSIDHANWTQSGFNLPQFDPEPCHGFDHHKTLEAALGPECLLFRRQSLRRGTSVPRAGRLPGPVPRLPAPTRPTDIVGPVDTSVQRQDGGEAGA